MSQDTHQTIARSTGRFFSGTLLSRFTGLLRDTTMAAAFGSHPSVAAFLIAFRFSHLARRLFGEGALHAAFVPHYERMREDDARRSRQFFRDLIVSLALFLGIAIGFGELFLLGVLWFGDLGPDNREIVLLSVFLLPSLLPICLFGVNASFLQCERSYFVPGVAPVAFNLIWIFAVIALWNTSAQWAMPYLAVGVTAGCVAQWWLTVPGVWKKMRGVPVRGSLFSGEVRRLLGPLAAGMIGVGAVQINSALDYVFVRYADLSGPAYLWYALRIQQIPIGLFGVALSGALLPPLARAIKEGDLARYQSFLAYAIRRTTMVMVPATLGLLVTGISITNLLYGRGDFGSGAVGNTTLCLWGYSLGLLPAVLVLVLAPACYAQQGYRAAATASCASVGLNICLNGLFVGAIGWGPASVAVATSISAWVNCALLVRALTKRGVALPMDAFFKTLTRVGGIAIVATTGTVFFGGASFVLPAGLSSTFFGQLTDFSVQISLFTAILAGLTWLLRRRLFPEGLVAVGHELTD